MFALEYKQWIKVGDMGRAVPRETARGSLA